MTTTELPNGQLLCNVHSPDTCDDRPCCIHNPSSHHMRDWPMVWRDDRDLMERTCTHGIGHPDPDHMAYVLTMPGPVDERESGVHGCDGCCLAPAPFRTSVTIDGVEYDTTHLNS